MMACSSISHHETDERAISTPTQLAAESYSAFRQPLDPIMTTPLSKNSQYQGTTKPGIEEPETHQHSPISAKRLEMGA
jgi:hypothetical protein